MTEKRALFIDDEAEITTSSAAQYVAELIRARWIVKVCATVQDTIDHLKTMDEREDAEDVVILDMMMPVPLALKNEVLDALSVGKWILRSRLRQAKSPYLKTPVLVLTNLDGDKVQRMVEGVDRTWVRHKPAVPSYYLPELLREILAKSCEMT